MADSNTTSNTRNAARLLAILGWLVLLISSMIAGTVVLVNYLAKESDRVDPGFWPSIIIAICVGVVFLEVARNLTHHRVWARYVGFFLSFASLIAFPVGTVMGLFILNNLYKGWNEK